MWVRLFAVVLVFAGLPGRAAASPQDTFGFGARGPAMAQTGVSFADDHEAVYLNPAGLGLRSEQGLSVGYAGGGYRLKVDDEVLDMDPSQGLAIGFYLPLPFGGPLEDVLTVGGAFYTPFDVIMDATSLSPSDPQFPVVGHTRSVSVMVSIGLSLERWVPGLRLGGGIMALASNAGDIRVRLEGNTFSATTNAALVADFAPLLGVLFHRNRFSLGLAYRGNVKSLIEFNVIATGLPIVTPEVTMTATPQWDPHQVSLEGSYTPREDLRFVANVTWRHWSAYEGPIGPTSTSSNPPPPTRFHDTLATRLAIEWMPDLATNVEIAVRGGLAFEPTPAPRARGITQRDYQGRVVVDENGDPVHTAMRLLDGHRLLMSTGVGARFEASETIGLRLDGAFQAQWSMPRTHLVPLEGRADNLTTKGFVLYGNVTAGVEW